MPESAAQCPCLPDLQVSTKSVLMVVSSKVEFFFNRYGTFHVCLNYCFIDMKDLPIISIKFNFFYFIFSVNRGHCEVTKLIKSFFCQCGVKLDCPFRVSSSIVAVFFSF